MKRKATKKASLWEGRKQTCLFVNKVNGKWGILGLREAPLEAVREVVRSEDVGHRAEVAVFHILQQKIKSKNKAPQIAFTVA